MKFINESMELLLSFSKIDFSDLDSIKQKNPPSGKKELVKFNDKILDQLINYLIFPLLTSSAKDKTFSLNNPSEETFFYTMNVLFSQCLEKKVFRKCLKDDLESFQNIVKTMLQKNILKTLDYHNFKHVVILYRILRALDNIDSTDFKGLKTITEELINSYVNNTIDSKFVKVHDLLHQDTLRFFEKIVQSTAFTEAMCKITKQTLKTMNLDEKDIKVELEKITNKLWDFIFISVAEPNTLAETFGDKFILFDQHYFEEIDLLTFNQKLEEKAISKFVITLIHELQHFLIRHFCKIISIFDQSPLATMEKDSGFRLEEALFGSKVRSIGFYDTEFVNDIKNWGKHVKNFRNQFTAAANKSKKAMINHPNDIQFKTYSVGRTNLTEWKCGTNLMAINWERKQEKLLEDALIEEAEKLQIEELKLEDVSPKKTKPIYQNKRKFSNESEGDEERDLRDKVQKKTKK